MKALALCTGMVLALLACERRSDAQEHSHRRFAAALDASLGRSRLHGVDIDTYDVHAAMGFSIVKREKYSVDWLFGTTLIRGKTEAGRPVSGFDLITYSSIVHFGALRFGAAAHLGVLTVKRSAAPDTQGGLYAGIDAIFGVEAFSIFYLDARLQARAWLGGMVGASLAAGVRY